jgi:hypothetical protein
MSSWVVSFNVVYDGRLLPVLTPGGENDVEKGQFLQKTAENKRTWRRALNRRV